MPGEQVELVEALARAMFAAVKRDSGIAFDEVPPIREAYMTGAAACLPIINAEIAAAVKADWQPIDTAPRDGTWVLGYWGRRDNDPLRLVVGSTHWRRSTRHVPGSWMDQDEEVGDPIYWMPLPPPPFVETHRER